MAHPYYPVNLSLPHYTPPTHSRAMLLLVMGGISAAVLALAWQFMSHINPALTRRAKATGLWFLYCGLLHIHFEGYFIRYRRTLAGRTDLVGELWKEYALSDSRYLSEDGFVVGIEALTVTFLGPLCLLTFLTILLESPKEHPARLLACCCHIYGVMLYFATELVSGNQHCRPEPLYFWGYYVGCNIPWLVVPTVLAWRSVNAMGEVVRELKASGDASSPRKKVMRFRRGQRTGAGW